LDLCWHLPDRLEQRTVYSSIQQARSDTLATLIVHVGDHHVPKSKKQPYKVTVYDDSGNMDLVFFHAHSDYLKKVLPPGQARMISGTITRTLSSTQMIHPDHMGSPQEIEAWGGARPLYRLTAGVHTKTIVKAIHMALNALPNLPEWLPEEYRRKREWESWKKSIEQAHHPEKDQDMESIAPARQRLAFDELLANQLTFALLRKHGSKHEGRPMQGSGLYEDPIRTALPFKLTNGQEDALKVIKQDMAASKRMIRLLQGDVGSGKTIVALLAMVTAVEAGYQAAFLAPTEILARQQFSAIKTVTAGLNLKIALFTGQNHGEQRKTDLEALQNGTIDIAIGTHALMEESIKFNALGFVVIDEQHRFGVDQRMRLIDKGNNADVLVMTATPIPRTLALTLYGELSVSNITEKPADRKPIKTSVLSLNRVQEVHDALKRVLEKGEKVYWVCPLIEESEKLDLGHAEARFKVLKKVFKDKVGLLHGRLKNDEKEKIMQQFKEGVLQILIATTVIEVGVDVPEATVMVIEHAERFGLSQLHQLRGRVGRSHRESSCLLLYDTPLSETGKKRLAVMRDTEDGFKIAEADLKIRGSGDVLGTRQSGLPVFHFVDYVYHMPMISEAQQLADRLIDRDPFLKSDQGKAARLLLHLFQYTEAIHYLSSG
jgi:ATP-dependent DNA helicase RecG